jgi:hypothetical protein
MGKVWYKISRVVVIILGILIGYLITIHYVKENILQPLCFVDSNSCIRVMYYKYNNSALIHVISTGMWLWYNGHKVYIYGFPTGQLCKEPQNYEAAYSIDPNTGMKEGYSCVMVLGAVIDFYKDKNVKPQYLVRRGEDSTDIYSILTVFQKDGILDFKN